VLAGSLAMMRPMRPNLVALLIAASVSAQTPPAASAPVDFEKQIAPILLARCIDCHGPKEQKGDLRLDAKAHVFAAGEEDGWTIVPKKPDDSELLRRLGLAPDDEEIMPAKGEPLSKEQQALVRQWIDEGAAWPASADEWIAKELAAMVLPKITFELPDVDAAGQAAIDAAVAELKKRGAVVGAVAADTPALDVNLSLLRDKVGDAELALLAPLASRLVWLNVSRTAVTDQGREHLARLVQLRRLHAAITQWGDAAFAATAGMPHLEFVNAYGTQLGDAGLAALAKLPKLARVYAWQSKVSADGARAAVAAAPSLQVDLGDYVEARMAAAQKEIAERNERNKPVNEMCPVATDKKVDPAITLEHDGRRVGFCCAKCKAAFQKEPAKYADKLPAKQ
jgi:mono/diheme cytochrome c family protein/YHS domain-containing protein